MRPNRGVCTSQLAPTQGLLPSSRHFSWEEQWEEEVGVLQPLLWQQLEEKQFMFIFFSSVLWRRTSIRWYRFAVSGDVLTNLLALKH